MNKKPSVYVLTLQGSDERQEHIRQQFSECGLDFSFYYGVDGGKKKTEIWAFYDDALRVRTKGYPLREGELGCFSSHYQLWIKCYLGKTPIIVLEDDVRVDTEGLDKFIHEAGAIPEALECIRLFQNRTRNHKSFTVLRLNSGQAIEIYSKGPMSAMGYYLTPRGAEKLLKRMTPLAQAVDIYMDSYWLHGVISAGVKVPVVHHDYLFGSMIGDRPREKKGLWMRLSREFYNFLVRLRRESAYIKIRRSFTDA